MGGKHLKKLRAEKSKVHLKKKKLSKAQNVTNTTFSVKKILAVEQLQKVSKDEPVSNWNVPLKDLLIRLNHYNFTSRLNSLTGIKELLTKYPDILRGPSLKLLISRLLELITDEEHKIRITTIDLLSFMFDLVSQSSIFTFQKILTLHLGCAMTHRNTSIQQDSLKFIDVMIKYSPETIKLNFKLIIHNFVRIMKSYFYESYAGVFSTGKSKQDLEKGKREMLCTFYQFITTGYPRVPDKKTLNCMDNNVEVFIRQKISLRDSSVQYKKIPDLSLFKNSENLENLSDGFNPSEFKNLCSSVIPLLFDTWVEYSPHQTLDESPECVLTDNAGELLSILLKIHFFLYEMAAAMKDTEVEYWFTSTYGPAFKKSFTFNFPYLLRVPSKRLKGTNFSDFAKGFDFYALQNLIICYLAYSLGVVDKGSKLETKIQNFVSGSMLMKSLANQEASEILFKIVKAGLHASECNKSNTVLARILATYDTTNNLELRQNLSKLLMDIALGETGKVCKSDQGMMNWMQSLPHRLCQPQVFVEEIQTIQKLITTPTGEEVLKETELKAEEILENLQNIKIEGITQLEGQKMIANVLYRCNSTVLIGILKKKILDSRTYHPDLKNYILDIFSQKLRNHAEFFEA